MGNADTKLHFRKAVIQLTTKTQPVDVADDVSNNSMGVQAELHLFWMLTDYTNHIRLSIPINYIGPHHNFWSDVLTFIRGDQKNTFKKAVV